MSFKSSVSKTICEARKRLGVSQREFAEKLGVSTSAVQKWELGLTTPRPDHWDKIARVAKLKKGSLFI